MAKTGDMVRYLNAVGGGKITRIEGQMAYVDEDGFETPVLLRELVVVQPAGHDSSKKQGNSASLMFDQAAFDAGKAEAADNKKTEQTEPKPVELPIEETAHGEKLNVVLAFEPSDLKHLGTASFAAVIVNDSNYYLQFAISTRSDDNHGWTLKYAGEVEPNMLVDVASIEHADLPEFERIAFQCIALKKEKTYSLKPPVSISTKIDLTKFYKLHCFRRGLYFDTPVLEVPLITDDVAVKALKISASEIETAMKSTVDVSKELSKKYKVDSHRSGSKNSEHANPNKLLPLIEIDLHIGELLDTTAGMSNSDILNYQLDIVNKTMSDNSRRKGQKIVFIHGKGDGVLRKAVIETLHRKWPKAEIQDASFREYGFGATLVTIH